MSIENNTQRDDKIEALVQELKPLKLLSASYLNVIFLVHFVIAGLLVLVVLGARPDLLAAINDGDAIVKFTSFALLAMGSAIVIKYISKPASRSNGFFFAFYALGLASFSTWAYTQIASSTSLISIMKDAYAPQMLQYGTGCFLWVLAGGTLSLYSLYHLWLKKSASPTPTKQGAVAGFFCGSLIASAYSLHCDLDNFVYVMSFYGGAVLIVSVLGAYLGHKHLRW